MNANEIGTAKVTAISASLPSKIAKAQPSIPPDTKSCGTEPPIEIAPINTSSKLAPKIIPACKSPNTKPTNGQIQIGRTPICPIQSVNFATYITIATKNALNNIFLFPLD